MHPDDQRIHGARLGEVSRERIGCNAEFGGKLGRERFEFLGRARNERQRAALLREFTRQLAPDAAGRARDHNAWGNWLRGRRATPAQGMLAAGRRLGPGRNAFIGLRRPHSCTGHIVRQHHDPTLSACSPCKCRQPPSAVTVG